MSEAPNFLETFRSQFPDLYIADVRLALFTNAVTLRVSFYRHADIVTVIDVVDAARLDSEGADVVALLVATTSMHVRAKYAEIAASQLEPFGVN